MAESEELKKIKKKYGEKFMHLCREIFPTILEQEGKLYEILTSTFGDNCKTLYEDFTREDDLGLLDELKDYVYSKFTIEKEKFQKTDKDPYQLLQEAGYDLYECHTEKEIQSFRKYFAKHEELCTFNGGRLNNCVVFFAVKKNVAEIKREEFLNPQREDEYGTSVMSIQFYKQPPSVVSIKNRYNHTVNNPDATYGNNLDRIIPGLTQSFAKLLAKRDINLNISNVQDMDVGNYIVAGDGKYYRFNAEINGDYCCAGNYIISNGIVKQLPPERYLLIDGYVIDLKEKKIETMNHKKSDGFIDSIGEIENITISKDKEKGDGNRIITIKQKNFEEPVIIGINKNNEITSIIDNNVKKIYGEYLSNSYSLEYIEMRSVEEIIGIIGKFIGNAKIKKLEFPNLRKVGHGFLSYNQLLAEKLILPSLEEAPSNFIYKSDYVKEINLPKLKKLGARSLASCKSLEKVYMPELQSVEDWFLNTAPSLREIKLPKLEKAYSGLLTYCANLENVYLPKLRVVEDTFLSSALSITDIDLPELTSIGHNFMNKVKMLHSVNMPKLKKVENDFLSEATQIDNISLPVLEEVGNGFLLRAQLKEILLPKLKIAREDFMKENKELEELELPELEYADQRFLEENEKIRKVYMPRLKRVEDSFLQNNRYLTEIDFPNLTKVGSFFIGYNMAIKKVNLPKLESAGDEFLESNDELVDLSLPALKSIGTSFMPYNNKLKNIYLPLVETIRNRFLHQNNSLKCINFPNLKIVEDSFLSYNFVIESVMLPNLRMAGEDFLASSKLLKERDISKLAKNISLLEENDAESFINGLVIEKDNKEQDKK